MSVTANLTLTSSTRVLVTGATGALGQALVRYLLEQTACQIVAIGRRAPTSLREGDGRLTYRLCRLESADDVAQALSEVAPDFVLHLAATLDDNFLVAQQINYQAAASILRWVAEHRRHARVLLIGSAAEYGVVDADENPISEARQLRPVSMYGHSKACQSQLVSYFAARGVQVVLARIFNLLGAGLSTRLFMGKVHAQIAEIKAGQRRQIEVGSLSASRDYLPIHEAVTQLMAITCYGSAGETYHVASGQPVTMRDLLSQELVKNSMDFSCVVEAPTLTNRVGYDVPMIYADMAKTIALMSQIKRT